MRLHPPRSVLALLHRLPRRLAARLPGRTVRTRLALVYSGLFLASGLVLLVLSGLLWGSSTSRPFAVSESVQTRILQVPGLFKLPAGAVVVGGQASGSGSSAVWQVAPAYARLSPTRTITSSGQGRGLRVALPSSGGSGSTSLRATPLPKQVAQQLREVAAQVRTVAVGVHATDLRDLLFWFGIALVIMAVLSIVLGWLMAGRVLRPLQTITTTVREISATNLHQRLDLTGPDDELKELGDTFDRLLGRLDRSFQSQRQFVANASHELRTPLATMRASLDVALAKPGPIPEQTAVLAERLNRELDQVDRLLEGFLALARAQSGPMDEDVPLPLDLLVTAALERRSAQVAGAGLDVAVTGCAVAWVSGNETLLARMVENVVDNAIHHNVPGGFVGVRTEVVGDSSCLVVENGGAVLDDAAVQRLGQPFHRLVAERTGSYGSIGLGLSIVAAVAEAHGGRLALRALPEGGLRVRVELPLAGSPLAGVSR